MCTRYLTDPPLFLICKSKVLLYRKIKLRNDANAIQELIVEKKLPLYSTSILILAR